MSKTTRNSAKPGTGTKENEVANSSTANLTNQALNQNEPDDVTKELAKLTALIMEKSESHDKKLEEIRVTTTATERKMTEILNRIAEAEDRLCFLEGAHAKQEANPPASSEEVELLRQKVDDMENRERRNNLRFVGFTESCEGTDAVAFLEATIPALFNITFPNGLEIQRAHRLGPRLAAPGNDHRPARPRAIIAQFVRFQDRERIAEAARKTGNVVWKDQRIMVFPDYSKLLTEKRKKFTECKKILHQKGVRFSLRFPAALTVYTPHGPMRFEDHKKALTFVGSLE